MIKQKDIQKILNCSQTAVSFILSGKRPISWAQAERLASVFPGKTIKEWKKATPGELKQAFTIHYTEPGKQTHLNNRCKQKQWAEWLE